eukprot:6027932-Pleurochrysis_carterae.AAC.4
MSFLEEVARGGGGGAGAYLLRISTTQMCFSKRQTCAELRDPRGAADNVRELDWAPADAVVAFAAAHKVSLSISQWERHENAT